MTESESLLVVFAGADVQVKGEKRRERDDDDKKKRKTGRDDVIGTEKQVWGEDKSRNKK